MKLYSIRHKITGKFFINAHYNGDFQWGKTPRYWTTIDGVNQNLIKLSCKMYFPFKGLPRRVMTLKELNDYLNEEFLHTYRDRGWKDFDKSKLKNIEVIVVTVSVLGESVIEPLDLLGDIVANKMLA